MSIFNEILTKINDIPNGYVDSQNDLVKNALEILDKFEADYVNSKTKTREANQKGKNLTILQIINEDEDEPDKAQAPQSNRRRSSKNKPAEVKQTTELQDESTEKPRRASKKRSKDEVDDMSSPEQDKRPKRNASVRAQSVISKQVNVNLTQKMRRDDAENPRASRSRRKGQKDDESDKENNLPVVKVKQEKISLPSEPMDTDALQLDVAVKEEVDKDDFAMPPPVAPAPKQRGRARNKDNNKELADESATEEGGRRRNTRTRKQTDTQPVPAPRSTRGSSRNTTTTQEENSNLPQPEARPKRTRAKKKTSNAASETEKDTTVESVPSSPAEKPRPKRTRRGKAAEKLEEQKTQEAEPTIIISPKEERISEPIQTVQSPILQTSKFNDETRIISKNCNDVATDKVPTNLEETRILSRDSADMDKTVVLPNGKYNHAPVTPKNVQVNETVVLESASRDTMVLDKPQIMNSTVVIEKGVGEQTPNITDDNSILTDDSDEISCTPPRPLPTTQPTSAVKEKVQQFEEMASRVTRTKTRAMTKKTEDPENQTPPDKVGKVVLSSETLTKMNNLIFNGKAPQISNSAAKPKVNVPISVKSQPSTTSKLSALAKAKEEAELATKEKEDARKKKEMILEAKRDLQKRKREEKMAAAAAARSAAERTRRAQQEAAARERGERQLCAHQGRLDRLKDAERKKQELARKAAETEERRKAEEQARQQRLAEEQKRMEMQRKRQIEEAEELKKEAAKMQKEIEKRQKEYNERQKLKQKMEAEKIHTPLRNIANNNASQYQMDPVYMADGFQYLNSDEEEDSPPKRPIPEWSNSKVRWQQLVIQSSVATYHVDRLFSVRVHSPDLRRIFPDIDRRALKRTSSAVWRTPPGNRLPQVAE